MPRNRKLQLVLLCLAAACGGKSAGEQSAETESVYNLTLAGSANLLLHPGDRRTLQVVLARTQVGPVAGASLHFELQDGDPAGATLDVKDVTTDSDGIATVHFAAGKVTDRSQVPKVVVTTPGLDANPVAFSFNVVPVRRLLQIVGSPVTHVAQDGLEATTSMGISASTSLRVRELDQDTGAPIAGDTLTFTKPASVKAMFSGAAANYTTADTGAGGEAQVYLLSTQQSEGPFLVSATSGGGGATAYFTVSISPAASTCSSSQSCNPGELCVGGKCTTAGGGACDAGNTCAFGWVCGDGRCQQPSGGACKDDSTCTGGQCCNGSSCVDRCPGACAAGTHCDPDGACGSATCVSDSSAIPDVTGVWMTQHTYDLRQALPTVLQDVGLAFRLLDQALHGKLTITGLPQWLLDQVNQLLSKLLAQYLPDWAKLVIRIGDGAFTVVSDLRAEGSMRLTKGVDSAHVKGTEVWTSLVFYWLPLCNGEIGGNPALPPDCARIDLYTTDSDSPGEVGQCKGQALPSITAQVAPFTATVSGTAAPWSLDVDQRQVKVKMGKVVLVLVDSMIYFATGGEYHCIDEATDCANGHACIVDCPALGNDVSGWTGGLADPALIQSACDAGITAAGLLVTQALANAWNPTAEVLDFKGHAVVAGGGDASTCDSGQRCAGQLGEDDYDTALHKSPGVQDGSWSGSFFLDKVKNMPGAWEAKRPQ